MKPHLASALLVTLLLTTATLVATADAAIIGCPAGQALQGVDTETGKFSCMPAGGAAAQLVDRDNVAIGQYLGHGIFSREIEGYRVDVCCMLTEAGEADIIAPAFLYTTPDCQGTPYFFAVTDRPVLLYRVGMLTRSGNIVFGGDPITTIIPRSFFDELDGCVELDPSFGESPVHPVVSVPLSSLGAPPFKIK